jgi:PAS domain S-box-containing protein
MNFLSGNILLPKHIEYLIIDRDFNIVDRSAGISRFINFPELLLPGKDVRESFPELFGYENILLSILEGERLRFDLPEINRYTAVFDILYLDIYFELYQEKYLIIFIEDVTYRVKERELIDRDNREHELISERVNSFNYLKQILASMADALLVTTEKGIIKTINHTTQKLLGYAPEELVDRPIDIIIADKNFYLTEIQNYLFSQGEYLKHLEIGCLTKNNNNIFLAFSCSLIAEENAEKKEFIYLGRDVTKIKKAQQRQNTQYQISRILAEVNNFAEVIVKILQALCENLGWDVAELWTIDNNKLKCLKIWSRLPLLGISREEIFLEKGEGLPGLVWSNNSAQWISDTDELYQHSQQIFSSLELRGAIAFPIVNEREIIGAISLFSQEIQKFDADLLKLLEAIGSQLGQYIHTKKTEQALERERIKVEKLLLNILPKRIAEKLQKDEGTIIADNFEEVTVLFADLVDFTQWSARVSPIEAIDILNEIFSEFDRLSEEHGLEKIKTIGDAYMLVDGLEKYPLGKVEKIAEMALDMLQAIAKFNATSKHKFKIRIGIDTGAVVAGTIGMTKFSYDLWGDTVNTASRMETQGIAGTIQVTQATYERLKNSYHFVERGVVSIKGKGEMNTYLLIGRKLSLSENLAS